MRPPTPRQPTATDVLCRADATAPWPGNATTLAEGGPLPDIRFATADGEVALHDFYIPCVASPRLFIHHSLAMWSRPSR